ncbi:MAG: hypothetical protein C3F17_06515 [Bradyrhizobiaceae bacterium]|nr:MAG: hypothetical protein C3F17_06515 [Bradyrhizobiaceae bacterium]
MGCQLPGIRLQPTKVEATAKSFDVGLLVTVTGALIPLLGYAFGHIRDVEDVYSTTVTTALFVRSLLEGHNPFWTDLLGLGMPQPFRISLVQHPLAILFGLVSPFAAVKIVVVLQGLLGTAFFYLLCRRLGMPCWIAVTCSLSFALCSSTIEFLFIDDFYTAYLSFSLCPVVLYLFLSLIERPEPAVSSGILLGTSLGLLVATGLASHVLSYLIVIGVFFCVPPSGLRKHWRSLAAAALVAATASSGLVTMLIGEWLRFPDAAARSAHHNPAFVEHVRTALHLPYLNTLGGSWSAFHEKSITDPLRVTSFGAIAALAAVAALIVPFGPLGARVKAAFVAAVLCLFLPAGAFANVISATWVFRDSVNVFGILLFGMLASRFATGGRIRHQVAVMLCIAQVAILTLLGLPRWSEAILNALEPTNRRASQAALEARGLVVNLKRLVGDTDMRIAMSQELGDRVRRNTLLGSGLLLNVTALDGLRVLNAFPRGIATGDLFPDEALMEGYINTTASNILDKSFLDTLGIGFLVTFDRQSVASGLVRIGTLSAGVEMLAVWRNPDAWPKVVEVDSAARDRRLPLLPGCGHEGFLCSDFSVVGGLVRSAPRAALSQSAGRIAVGLAAAERDRVLLLNSWYRPGWRSEDPRVTVTPVFGHLLGVLVPAGVDEFALVYRPPAVVWSYAVSSATLLMGLAVAIAALLRLPRRACSRSELARGRE